jgi:hypothetical protein
MSGESPARVAGCPTTARRAIRSSLRPLDGRSGTSCTWRRRSSGGCDCWHRARALASGAARRFGKGVELGREAKAAHLPPELYAGIQTWLRRYKAMVAGAHNGIMHAHGYTVSNGPDGWVPGLNYTDREGSEHRIAQSPAELHAIAGRIGQLMSCLAWSRESARLLCQRDHGRMFQSWRGRGCARRGPLVLEAGNDSRLTGVTG